VIDLSLELSVVYLIQGVYGKPSGSLFYSPYVETEKNYITEIILKHK
jgi:hypothetical protein